MIGIRKAALVTVLSVLVLNGRAITQTHDQKLDITAVAVNMSNLGTGNTFPIQFSIERWSTEAERQGLIATMLEKGPDALLKAFQDMPSHGRMRGPTWTGPDPLNVRLGWDLKYACDLPGDFRTS